MTFSSERTRSTGFAPSRGGPPAAFARSSLTGEGVVAAVAAPTEPRPEPQEAVDTESLRREAYEEGRASALAELPWREVEALERAKGRLEAAARALSELRSDYLQMHRSLCVDLALAIAETVIGREPAIGAAALADRLERALARLGAPEAVSVRLASADHEALEPGLAPELARLLSEHGVELVPDPRLSPGDLVVEGAFASIDARRTALLGVVREELRTLLEPGGCP